MVKNPPAMWETWIRSLGWEDPLEEGMATHSSVLAWRIPVDRGAWWAIVHGVTKICTRLTDKHSTAQFVYIVVCLCSSVPMLIPNSNLSTHPFDNLVDCRVVFSRSPAYIGRFRSVHGAWPIRHASVKNYNESKIPSQLQPSKVAYYSFISAGGTVKIGCVTGEAPTPSLGSFNSLH